MMPKTKKIKILKQIKSKVKEVKEVKEQKSDLEEELEYSEDEQFSNFVGGGGSVVPTLSTGQVSSRVSGSPQIDIPTASVEEPVSGMALYDTGRGLGDQRAAYVSNAATLAGATLRPRNVGSDFAMASSQSSLPEEQIRGLSRDSLSQPDIGSDKYEASTPSSQAAKKFKYEWE